MTKKELKKVLVDSGNDNPNITENDLETLSSIINQCHSPEEAYKKLSETYSGFSEDALKADTNLLLSKITSRESDDIQNLSDEVLESVAGGSKAGDWFKNNWGYIVGGVAILGLSVGVGYGIGKISGNKAMANAKEAGYNEGYALGKGQGKFQGFTGTLQARKLDDLIPVFQSLGIK